MGQLILVEKEGWCELVMGESKLNHYFEQEEIDKLDWPKSLCGKLISADLHGENVEKRHCKACERRLEKQRPN